MKKSHDMLKRLFSIIAISCCLATGPLSAEALDSESARHDIHLSPELLELLRAEMREIAGGMQVISVALATADWPSIHKTSIKIRDSYIMQQSLTPAQKEELGQELPVRFKELDGAFHQRAEKLGEAAVMRDLETAVFQYSRMLEDCAGCHSLYAKSRFPGFSSEAPQHDHH